MGDPYVRVVGQVEDMDGAALAVGVDYHTVTIGRPPFADWRLESRAAEEFARLFVSACWEASAQAAAMTDAAVAVLADEAKQKCEAADHEHAHPVQPPEGQIWAPGPCRICGITYARAQAERRLREAQAALGAPEVTGDG